MEIVVHGRNLTLPDAVVVHASDRVEHAGRVFDQAVERVDVEIAEEPNPRQSDQRYRVELTAAVSGRVVRIESAAAALDSALDDSVDRLTRQIRRLKEKLIDRSRRPDDVQPADEVEMDADEIVRVKQFVTKPMTLEEATLQMDMLGHSFFFFLNAATDRHSVLYRRRDGRLGLIEPS